jgi:hypothetical protein
MATKTEKCSCRNTVENSGFERKTRERLLAISTTILAFIPLCLFDQVVVRFFRSLDEGQT